MIEFFFGCLSPWTYLAFHNIQPLAREFGAEISSRGGFGSPTIFIDKSDMCFGNDRLPLVREALQRRKVGAERAASAA
jgi:2-hydroxychromene-2-carboxylate isomerase